MKFSKKDVSGACNVDLETKRHN